MLDQLTPHHDILVPGIFAMYHFPFLVLGRFHAGYRGKSSAESGEKTRTCKSKLVLGTQARRIAIALNKGIVLVERQEGSTI